MGPSSSSGSPSNELSQGLGSMLVTPSPTLPPRVQSLEHALTIPDRTAIISRRHSTFSPLHASRPLRSSPLAGPSIDVAQDDTRNPGSLRAPSTPRGGTKHLSPLTVTPAIADPGGEEDVAAQKRRQRTTFSVVLSKMSFPSSSTSSTTPAPPSTSSTSSGSSASSVPDQPVGKPRRRMRSLGAEDAPPVPPMPVWAHDKMPNRRSQNLSSFSSLSPSPSSSHPPVLLRPASVSVPNSPHSSRENLSAPRPRPRPDHARRSVVQPHGQGQGQVDARMSTRLSIAGRLPPSTSRNPEENWLTQAAVPKFSRAGLKAQGVVMPVSARAARRASTVSMSTASASAAARTRSLGGGGPSRPPAAHVAPAVSHGRVPRRPSTAPSLGLLPMPIPSSDLRSRTSSLASTRSRVSASVSASTSEYFGDHSVSGEGEGEGEGDAEGEGRGEGSETPPLTTSSTTTSASSSLSVSFADPPVSRADEFGIILPAPESGVQIQLNDVIVPPEAFYNAPYDVKGKGRGKGKDRVVAVDVKSVGPAGSISSMASQTYGAQSVPRRRESLPGSSGADALWFGPRQPLHARAASAPAETKTKAKAREGITAEEKENLKRRRSTIARVWKQVVRSVAHR
ncbi:hypothetical protein GSI_09403 [Ganoderma sinense ZZ0214-1]|uniref:Uncharacterized protein n=1 Tax=Ganoderma sinense ZZ0214-1 TaxID=1077348 RepID=A0A2G8S6E8_9APHY|nr:hypothetical protein GSI_09403 [Ganoderma sinense ZZ0214-1]